MKYNGFYFWMFKSPMKKVLAEKYGREYAADIMKKSKKVYRELVEKADDIGDDNPMAYNELFALAFVAPYVASEKKIPTRARRRTKRALSNTPNGTRPKRKRNTRPPSRWILSGSRMRGPVTTALPAARFAFTRRNSVFPNSCRCSANLMK